MLIRTKIKVFIEGLYEYTNYNRNHVFFRFHIKEKRCLYVKKKKNIKNTQGSSQKLLNVDSASSIIFPFSFPFLSYDGPEMNSDLIS